jgi:hypothetical protein
MSQSNVKRNSAEKDVSVEKVSFDEERSGGVTLRLANNVQAKCVLDSLVFPSSNNNFRIQNPLYGIPRQELMRQVEEFTKEKGLDDKLELFQRAALLAQSQKDFENIPELSDEDKEVIRRETTRPFIPFLPRRKDQPN